MIRFKKLLRRCDSHLGKGLAVREFHRNASLSGNVANIGGIDHDKGNSDGDGGGGGFGVWHGYDGLNSGNRSYAEAIVEPSRYRRWKTSTL